VSQGFSSSFRHVHDDTSILVFYKNLELQFKFQNAGKPDCPASSQSGTGLKITNDAGTGPVPD
jgi:hypothetical protein